MSRAKDAGSRDRTGGLLPGKQIQLACCHGGNAGGRDDQVWVGELLPDLVSNRAGFPTPVVADGALHAEDTANEGRVIEILAGTIEKTVARADTGGVGRVAWVRVGIKGAERLGIQL